MRRHTGRYDWDIELTANYSSGKTSTRVFSGSAEIVHLSDSVFGQGWTISELDELLSGTGGVLYVSGTGLTGRFADNPSGGYISPAGPLATHTLVQNVNGTFTLTDKFGKDANFSSAGLLSSRVDRNGNTTALAYTGENGIDATVVDGVDPGFSAADLKPFTQSGVDKFEEQVGDWGLMNTTPFFYDKFGHIWPSGWNFP